MPSGGHNRKPAPLRQTNRVYPLPPPPADKPAPPDTLSAAGRLVFLGLVDAMPAGVAGKSDSLALGVAAELLAQFQQSPDSFPASRLGALRALLADFGLTPPGRRRLEVAPVEAENPFAAIDRLRQKVVSKRP